MNKPDTAIILAAGLGSRLEAVFPGKPKGLLEIGGMSLVGRSLDILKASGIDRFLIGTGYLDQYYEPLAKQFDAVCVFNGKFSETGSMYTLWNMRHCIGGAFLLLESDLLYHPSAIDILLDDERADVILASGPTHSGDEVFIECSNDGLLINMSKDRSVISKTDTELVGISKISTGLFRLMCDAFEQSSEDNPKFDYEEALVAASKRIPIYVKKSEALVWCEIDDPSHLKRATGVIWPLIRKDCR
jgi:2-aminoethylphosphonate-pyruvate transaminase